MKSKIISLSIALVLITSLYTDLNVKLWEKPNKVIEWDVISYYAYLPAFFIYDDVSLKFQKDYQGAHHFVFWGEKLPNDNYLIKTTMGLSFMYAPFFFVGHIIANFFHYDSGGFSLPYRLSLVFAALFYLAIGLFFLAKILAKYFSKTTTAITIITVGLGTNLFHYSTAEPGMSHVYNFTLFILLLYLVIKWHEKITFWRTLSIGLLLGLLTLIRPINILAVIIFIFYDVNSWEKLKAKFFFFLKEYKQLIIIALSAFFVILPQLIYWKFITGQWVYYSYTNERFFFDHPKIFDVLFSFRKGFFIYTPVMLLGTFGLFYLQRYAKKISWAIWILLLVYIYVISSWWAWWYGGSLGMRPLIDVYGLFAFGLAAFIEIISKQKKILRIAVFSIASLFVVQGILINLKYHYSAIHWDSMTKASYFDSFFRIHPSANFYNLLQVPNYAAARMGLAHGKSLKKKPFYILTQDADERLVFATDFEISNELTTTRKAFEGNYSYSQNKQKSSILNLKKEELIGLGNKKIEYSFSSKFYSDSASKCNFSIVISSTDKVLHKTFDFKNLPNKWNQEWETISFKDTLDTIPLNIQFYLWNKDSSQIFYFDNLKISFQQLP